MIIDRHKALSKVKKNGKLSIENTLSQSFQSESNSHISTNTLEYDNQLANENNNYNSALEFSQLLSLNARPTVRQLDSSLALPYADNILNSEQETTSYGSITSKFCAYLT